MRATVLGCALLGALLLVVAEFTTLFTVHEAGVNAPIKSVGTGSHDAYALIPIALLAVALAWGAVSTGNLWALVALGAVGVAALLIALIGDLPDAQATGAVGNLTTGLRQGSSTPSAGLYLETVGAVVLIIASGCGLLLSRGAPAGAVQPARQARKRPAEPTASNRERVAPTAAAPRTAEGSPRQPVPHPRTDTAPPVRRPPEPPPEPAAPGRQPAPETPPSQTVRERRRHGGLIEATKRLMRGPRP